MDKSSASLAAYWNRMLNWKEAQNRRLEGYKIGVLHLHSSYSRDVPDLAGNRPAALLDKGIREGADYIAITDHDNDSAWREAGFRPACWIRGVEMEVFDRLIGHPVHLGILHIRGDELSDELHDIALRRNDAHLLVRTALDNGATVIANHPWWGPRGYYINSIRYWNFIEHYQLPVEVNEKRSYIENLATLIYAAQRNLPVVATTDSHTRKVLPTCTVARGETPEEFLANIRKGENFIIPGYAGLVQVPAMMARYVLDVIQSSLPRGYYKNPLSLATAPVVDRIIDSISSGEYISRIVKNRMAALFTGSLTYLVCALLYIPSAYATSSFKVLKDLYIRSGSGGLLPELLAE